MDSVKCAYCPLKFENDKEFLLHFNVQHAEGKGNTFCYKCDIKIKGPFEEHVKIWHPFHCVICVEKVVEEEEPEIWRDYHHCRCLQYINGLSNDCFWRIMKCFDDCLSSSDSSDCDDNDEEEVID